MVGADDPSLTANAGLVLVAGVERILGVVDTIDARVGRIKSRRQGLSAGELVLSMAECMLRFSPAARRGTLLGAWAALQALPTAAGP